ncbi:MAG: helix-turn-helix domain-containing protein [Saprospiraceae bacterium]|nr:helix-turn-helix domain-containing protein [Candidatus Brachybacter algidus]MBP7307320.1 helix-turn-helix domain-containing protein [Saprospiraceae bacterium]MBK7604647.1 helix-turn-helix domain-containing protein [Candidatus Brachybacter algidus]MBK8747668.1 helix-turn-helix domain-containing protein [Candidatus Brachybacter algidus]MBK9022817.1 helix-turn-helix domain-containing protein [Candidatus Brachybacter algidus]
MNIFREITPLGQNDVYVLLDSYSNGFDYPIHSHPEYELNLVMGVSGVRLVGDNTERFNEYDLVLLGPYLYHKWTGDEYEDGKLKKYRVVTIQFSIDLFEGPMFQKERFYRIRKMLDNSIRGIKFEGDVFKTAMTKMLSLTKDKGFTNILEFIDLLDLLSKTQSITYLASEGFTPATLKWESKRIQQAYNYIIKNFSETKFKLNDVAALINMSESAFSHFFRKYTNKSFTEFLTDVRIGHTCKLLLSTDETISQIAYRSGFNNIANFNRLFKKNKNCTPLEYRQRHKEKTIYDWQEEINMWQFLPPNSKNLDMVGPAINTTKVTHI